MPLGKSNVVRAVLSEMAYFVSYLIGFGQAPSGQTVPAALG
jgi:hypothetical protein